MRKLYSICKRIARRDGVRLCVLSSGRGVYRLYRYSTQMETWYYYRTFGSVAECEDYLKRFER